MARLAWSALAIVLALVCEAPAAHEEDLSASAAPCADSALPEPTRWSFGPHADPTARFSAFAPKDLARGTLLRAKFDDDTSLMLRLRGRRIGLYLSIRLGD